MLGLYHSININEETFDYGREFVDYITSIGYVRHLSKFKEGKFRQIKHDNHFRYGTSNLYKQWMEQNYQITKISDKARLLL